MYISFFKCRTLIFFSLQFAFSNDLSMMLDLFINTIGTIVYTVDMVLHGVKYEPQPTNTKIQTWGA